MSDLLIEIEKKYLHGDNDISLYLIQNVQSRELHHIQPTKTPTLPYLYQTNIITYFIKKRKHSLLKTFKEKMQNSSEKNICYLKSFQNTLNITPKIHYGFIQIFIEIIIND